MTHNGNTRRYLCAPVSRECASGFGLVELMVSIVIGLIMIAALVALFLGTSRNNREMATANSMIENGRFAIQLLESDIVHAGFWGTFVPQFDDATADGVPGDVPTDVPDPCLPYDPVDWNAAYVTNLLGVPVQAYDSDDVCSGAGAPVEDMRAGTDLLVVRHAATCAVGEAGCEGDVAGKLYMQSSLCPADAATFVFGRTGTAVFDLHRRHGSCEDGGPVDVGVPFAEKRRFVSNLYYVRDLVIDGVIVPTLMRSTFDQAGTDLAHQPAVPLVEGIDAFLVEFGVDSLSGSSPPEPIDYTSPTEWEDDETKEMATNRGDGIPDGAFIRCTTAAPCGEDDLMNTTAVRLWVLARSREPTQGYTDTKEYILAGETYGPYDDGFKRHVYSTTLRLPNISGRRERP
jgi:type IV pilus assembly protein PilW